MLLAETAVLAELKTIGIVLFVLHGVVISLLAFGAGKNNLDAHCSFLLIMDKIHPKSLSTRPGLF